jgi:hypothetical protein
VMLRGADAQMHTAPLFIRGKAGTRSLPSIFGSRSPSQKPAPAQPGRLRHLKPKGTKKADPVVCPVFTPGGRRPEADSCGLSYCLVIMTRVLSFTMG